MNITKKQKLEISYRKQNLNNAKLILKSEFVGLDLVIDEIIDILQPWYIFPNGQLRPTVVGLWGLTGVGKTSLVRRLSELINMEKKLFKFDIGDYCSGDLKLRYEMSSKLKNHEKQPVILVYDEFQLGRTITEQGMEQDRNGLRAVWDILDSGKFHVMNDNYYAGKLATVIIKLDECIRGGVEVKNGVITKNKNIHNAIFYPDGKRKGKKTKHRRNHEDEDVDKDLLVPEEHHYSLYTLCEKQFVSESAVAAHLFTLDEKQTMEFLHKILEESIEPIEHDFSQAIIFIIGNVDEAYMMSDNVDPDVDADIFYKHSLKITVTNVKNALLKRFRAEQIARFGNNFIIYPAFNSESYQKLINMELNKVKKRVLKDFGLLIEFDNSIGDIIYKESVFPTQGTRPIFTTISCMVESFVCKILSFSAENMSNVKHINWSYFDDNYKIQFYDNDQTDNPRFTEIYPIKLKVENLRRSSMDEEQANTAIHEAGHAVLCSLILGIIPEEIVSKTAGMGSGFCRTEIPDFKTKSVFEKDIIISLGGYLAETLVFGDDNITNGAVSDIEHATGVAVEYVRSYGMSGLPMKISVPDISMNGSAYFDYKESDKLAKKLIISCKKKAFKCLSDNMFLLLKMGEYLSTNSRMTKEQIQEFVVKYNSYGVREFKTKDNFYEFKKEISKKLIGAKIVHELKKTISRNK
jgi:cell division protease FtsH